MFDTAVAVAERFFPDPTLVGLATAEAFADALIGGAITGRSDTGPGPVLLTDPDQLPQPIEDYLQSVAASVDTAVIFGGTDAISSQTQIQAEQALGL